MKNKGESKKMKKNRVFSIITSALVLLTSINASTVNTFAVQDPTTPIENYQNISIASDSQAVNVSSDLNKISALDQGTVVVRFKSTSNAALQALFSISNNTVDNGYYALYYNSSTNKVGFEARTQTGSTTTALAAPSTTVTSNLNGFNTLALKVTKNTDYKLFFNGKLVNTTTAATTYFFKDIVGANAQAIGKIYRGGISSSKNWLFNGDIDYVKVYNSPLDDSYLSTVTGETFIDLNNQPLPSGVVKTNPVNLTYPGFANSDNFRIPSLYTTKAGSVLAGMDLRYGSAADTPNHIDEGIRISKDSGKSWDSGKRVVYQSNNGASIDPSILQDSSNGRIYMLFDVAPDGVYFGNSKKGSGYSTVNGVRCLNLYDSLNNVYTVQNGVVYNSSNIPTTYTVDSLNNVYQNGSLVGNAFSSSCPLKVLQSFFLKLVYSDNDGQTWSDPIDITPQTKQDWMYFFGTGPGRGIQLKNGTSAGRLIFPIYYTNANGKQSSAVVYSDDHGTTWKLGESPNDGRVEGTTTLSSQTLNSSTYELTESQAVEMPDGQVKLFCRNYGGKVAVATSFDGGATWDSAIIKDFTLADPYCQMSVINYSQKIDGLDAIIFSNPNSTSSRNNGTVRIGLIEASGTLPNGKTNYTFNWKYSQLVKSGNYGYSCLTELPNGNIGLFYEGDSSNYMQYTEMNIPYIEWVPTIQPVTYISSQLIGAQTSFKSNDSFGISYNFDQRVIGIGTRTITAQIGGISVPLTYCVSDDGRQIIFNGTIPALSDGSYPINISLPTNLKIYNVAGTEYSRSGSEVFNGTINISNAATISTPILNYQTNKSFTGTEYNDISNDISAVSGLTQGSIVAKFSSTSTAAAKTIFSLSHSADSSSNMTLSLNNGALHFENRENGTYSTNFTTTNTNYNDGATHVVALNVSNSGTTLFVDGVKVYTGTQTAFASSILTPDAMNIGRNLDKDAGTAGQWYFIGNISYVQVYSTPLTDSESAVLAP